MKRMLCQLIVVVFVVSPLVACQKQKKQESILQWSNSQTDVTQNKS